MYPNYEYDVNQISVQVENVFYHMNIRFIDMLNEAYGESDINDNVKAEQYFYHWLEGTGFVYSYKLLLDKLAMIFINSPDSFFDYYGIKQDDDCTRLGTIKIFCEMFNKVMPLSYILDVIVEVLQNENY